MTSYDERPANMDDCRFVWELRNSKEGREVSINSDYIPYEEHEKWYKKHIKQITILYKKDKIMGYFRKSPDSYISIMLIKSYRNKGIGTSFLNEEFGKAIILIDNMQSIKSFIKAGFKLRGFYLEK